MSWFGQPVHTAGSPGFDLSRLVRRMVVLGSAVIQLVLVARILLDLGVIPEDGTLPGLVIL